MDVLSTIRSLSSGLWSELRCNIQKLTKFPSWLEHGANNNLCVTNAKVASVSCMILTHALGTNEIVDPRRDQFSFLMFFELGCVKPEGCGRRFKRALLNRILLLLNRISRSDFNHSQVQEPLRVSENERQKYHDHQKDRFQGLRRAYDVPS
jgi:hypothetical protein